MKENQRIEIIGELINERPVHELAINKNYFFLSFWFLNPMRLVHLTKSR